MTGRPFAGTRAALRALRRRFRLATISNTDDDLFARTDQQLDVAFDRSPEKQSPQDLEILGAVWLRGLDLDCGRDQPFRLNSF